MAASDADKNSAYNKELCEMRHASTSKELIALREEYSNDIKELWAALDQIRHPSAGHIATLKVELETTIATTKTELEAKLDKQDSKINSLILSLLAAAVSTAVAIGGEFLKRFLKT